MSWLIPHFTRAQLSQLGCAAVSMMRGKSIALCLVDMQDDDDAIKRRDRAT
jgi:hypothetical protein